MTREWFDHQMLRMAGLRFVPADMGTHWEGLNTMPEDVLERAITRAIRTRSEFPTPLELRQDADANGYAPPTEPEPAPIALAEPKTFGAIVQGTPLALHITHEHRYACDVCSDSGWAPLLDAEGRHYVKACVCRDSNPEIRRKRQAQAKYAEQRATKGAA